MFLLLEPHLYNPCVVFPCKTNHRAAGVFGSGCHGPEPGHRANCRKPTLCMFSIIQEDMSGLLEAESVSAELMEGDRQGEEVHLSKWIACRDAGAATWTHFTSADGESKIKRTCRIRRYLSSSFQMLTHLLKVSAGLSVRRSFVFKLEEN